MIRILVSSCVFILMAGVPAKDTPQEKPTHEHAAKEYLRLMKSAAAILKSVDDQKSADAAIVQLKAIRKEAFAYWAMTARLGDAPAELENRYEKEQRAACALFVAEWYRIEAKRAANVQEAEAFYLAMVRGCETGAKLEWRWTKEKASLAYSTKEHLPDYDVEVGKEFYTPITIRNKKDRAVVYSLNDGHTGIVFTRHKDTIFVAEYYAIAHGCTVVAVDLKTGKTLWRSRLWGIGFTGHSKYKNRINIETDGVRITIHGNESHGRYVEQLDINTGHALAHVKFEPDYESWDK